jgi:signal transduction histidine kinase
MLTFANSVRKPLARQLMHRLALAASLFAVLTTMLAALVEYRDERKRMEAVFTQIEEGYLNSVAETVWLEDRDGLALLALGVSRLPHVARVEIRDADGALLTAAGPDGPTELSHIYRLLKIYKDKEVDIGTLSVWGADGELRSDALRSALLYGLASLLLVAATSAFLYFMVQGLIGRPLERLAASARNLGQRMEDKAFLADLEMQNLENEFGLLVRTLAAMQSELAQTFADMKTSEARYRDLFANTPTALWEEDYSAVQAKLDALRGQIDDLDVYIRNHPSFLAECASLIRLVDVNLAALRLHEADSKEELLGELSRMLPPEAHQGLRKALLALWGNDREIAFESEIRTLKGDVREVVVHWLALPAQEGSHRVIVSLEDVTDRVEARHSLAQTVERLMQANSELERFTHAAAHDLAEPVRSIASFAQLLERSLGTHRDPAIVEYLGFLVGAAKRMQAQVRGLQDYARIGEGVEHRESCSLDTLLDRALELLKEPLRLAQADIERHPLPTLFVNCDQIADVLRNVLDNAIKFAKPGLAPMVRISAQRHGKEWVVSIADNGIGIDPRYTSDVFQVFRRLNPPSHTTGEGIGLSLCKRIVERHGGRMWVESNLGQGATFHIALPASDEQNAEAAQTALA